MSLKGKQICSLEDYNKSKAQIEQLLYGTRNKPFLGLSNQGATCYMNSLLQALFMTT